eukprot:TRINITY_DN5045_c0_g1_i1.p1 TRINITY_DN5045_c0_g1~~TRINITY_DN5045_c0_g1_i1.p1  ORF type:complete len:514 (+),score=129.02 TRINITY_DN5045_c0_g1_i1:24-1565(+)
MSSTSSDLPEGWKLVIHKNAQDAPCYWHEATHVVVWTKPYVANKSQPIESHEVPDTIFPDADDEASGDEEPTEQTKHAEPQHMEDVSEEEEEDADELQEQQDDQEEQEGDEQQSEEEEEEEPEVPEAVQPAVVQGLIDSMKRITEDNHRMKRQMQMAMSKVHSSPPSRVPQPNTKTRKQQITDPHARLVLWVGGLPGNLVDDKWLAAIFSDCGEIVASVMCSRQDGDFGWVQFARLEDAIRAQRRFHGALMGESTLKVFFSEKDLASMMPGGRLVIPLNRPAAIAKMQATSKMQVAAATRKRLREPTTVTSYKRPAVDPSSLDFVRGGSDYIPITAHENSSLSYTRFAQQQQQQRPGRAGQLSAAAVTAVPRTIIPTIRPQMFNNSVSAAPSSAPAPASRGIRKPTSKTFRGDVVDPRAVPFEASSEEDTTMPAKPVATSLYSIASSMPRTKKVVKRGGSGGVMVQKRSNAVAAGVAATKRRVVVALPAVAEDDFDDGGEDDGDFAIDDSAAD